MTQTLTKKILELEDIKNIKPDMNLLPIISKNIAQKVEALVFDKDKKKLFLLTTNNYPQLLSQVLDRILAKWYKVEFFYTDDDSFKYAMSWYDESEAQEQKAQEEIEHRQTVSGKEAEEMIKKVYEERNRLTETEFIHELIRLSYQAGSSDLHFQPEEMWFVMRIRKDWVLKTVLTFDHNDFKKYFFKLKYLSSVRLNVDYLPQDWRFDFEMEKWNQKIKIDVRVSFMPWLRGESVVMRYLDSSKWIMSFTEIWFWGDNLNLLMKNLKKNYWMILMTWPTGSGKTTSLYSMLNYLNSPGKKIITVEDPVEYEMPGIQQSQINDKKWYTYEEWLKSILRQDPDIIMVWEIRTLETAEIAINAALTWHLVLSTLHTNTAIEAISRLLNMWVKPYMLAPALNLIVWQRLVRKLHTCADARQADMAEQNEIQEVLKRINDTNKSMNLEFDGKLPNPVGCEECGMDWYTGRIAILEAFDVNDDIKNMIIRWKSTIDIYWSAREHWFLNMKEDAYIKLLQWKTTLDEIRRVL